MLFGWTWMDKIELWLDLILNDDKFICYNLLWFISSCIENELFAEERRKLNRLYFSSHASYASDRQFCNSPHTCTGMLIAHWSHCGIVYLCQFRHRGMPSIPKCINPEYRTCPTECIQHIPHPLLCKSSIVDAFKSKKKKHSAYYIILWSGWQRTICCSAACIIYKYIFLWLSAKTALNSHMGENDANDGRKRN